MAKTSPFGAWLRKWRKARGLTQVQLASKAECGNSIISQYERGERQEVGGEFMRPETDLVERLATVLNRPVEEARALAGYFPSPAPPTLAELNQMHADNPGSAIYLSRDYPRGLIIPPEKTAEFLQAMQIFTEILKMNSGAESKDAGAGE